MRPSARARQGIKRRSSCQTARASSPAAIEALGPLPHELSGCAHRGCAPFDGVTGISGKHSGALAYFSWTVWHRQAESGMRGGRAEPSFESLPVPQG